MTNTPTKMIKERINFTRTRTDLIKKTTQKQMPSVNNGIDVKSIEAGRKQFVEERTLLTKVMEIIFKDESHKKVTKLTKKHQALIAKWNETHMATAAKDEGLQL